MSRDSGAGAYSHGMAWPSPSPQLDADRAAAGTTLEGVSVAMGPLWHRVRRGPAGAIGPWIVSSDTRDRVRDPGSRHGLGAAASPPPTDGVDPRRLAAPSGTRPRSRGSSPRSALWDRPAPAGPDPARSTTR